jgi:DNA (cytosine-5)-methyltransferase 1
MLALDLFAGMGWGVACQQLGIHEDGIEMMPDAIATREMAGMHTPFRDVQTLPEWAALHHDILIASPPCQTFSVAGKGVGFAALQEVERRAKDLIEVKHLDRTGGDPRTWLVLEPLRIAMGSLPMFVVWEQVPTVLPFWQYCAEIFKERGYSTWVGMVNAEQFGVPQTRRRALLIARRDGKRAAPPTPTHSRFHNQNPTRLDAGVKKWISMCEALGCDPGRWLRSNYAAPGPAGMTADERGRTMRPVIYPATVITSKRVHWTDSHDFRAERTTATVAEVAALQSFPASMRWAGTTVSQYLQIGNAVPPLLGQAILETFL